MLDRGHLQVTRVHYYSRIFVYVMETLLSRISTYTDSTLKGRPDVQISQLGVAGFYSVGQNEESACFSCGLTLKDWPSDPDPVKIHQAERPDCEFIRHLTSKVPTGIDDNTRRGLEDEQKTDDAVEGYSRMMTSQIIEALVSMGYTHAQIDRAKELRYNETGAAFPSLESVLDCIEDTPVLSSDLHVTGGAKGTHTDQHGETSPGISSDPAQLQELSEHELQALSKRLTADVAHLKERDKCIICFDEPVSVVILRCGHHVCCSTCAANVYKCPVCREVIRGTVRVLPSVP